MTRSVVIEKIETVTALDDSGDVDVVVVQPVPNSVVIEVPQINVVEVISAGPQGPPGPSGQGADAVSIVGYPVVLLSGQPDDLLSFTGTEWKNKPQAQVTDGGNF